MQTVCLTLNQHLHMLVLPEVAPAISGIAVMTVGQKVHTNGTPHEREQVCKLKFMAQ